MRQFIGADAFNLVNGHGFTGKGVIDCAQAIVTEDQKTIDVVEESRSAAYPAVLVADSSRAKKALDWQPEFNRVKLMVSHAWQW